MRIKKSHFDEYGQRVYIRYGNGVESEYTYDQDRRWLASVNTGTATTTYQNMGYEFDAVGNVLGITNQSSTYQTSQNYRYDGLYQLTGASGNYTSRPFGYTEYTANYSQDFSFDTLGNLTQKVSSSQTSPNQQLGADLNYHLTYQYAAGKVHQAEVIGNRYYRYDANGNVVAERDGGHSPVAEPGQYSAVQVAPGVQGVGYGFGVIRNNGGNTGDSGVFSRRYTWNEENRLTQVSDNSGSTNFRYDADGKRTHKYSRNGESLYFDAMYSLTDDYPQMRYSQHIYLSETRIASRMGIEGYADTGYARVNTYYYHGDHLGSAHMITDFEGNEYEHIEYTPYGEMWIERTTDSSGKIPFRFTGKEWDTETGLYYYGARYMDPRTSRWMSADPAGAGLANPNREGFSQIESLNWYSYVANNPVKFTDPTGEAINFGIGALVGFITSSAIEIGQRMGSGQGFMEAVGNTFTDPTSLAIIGTSTLIGAATSGVSGLAVKAATAGATSVAEAAIKTVAINTISGAADAAMKDVAGRAITGQPQNLAETAGVALQGAGNALLTSGITQAVISNSSMTSTTTFSNNLGVEAGTTIVQPSWAGSVGVIGESVIPAAAETAKALVE